MDQWMNGWFAVSKFFIVPVRFHDGRVCTKPELGTDASVQGRNPAPVGMVNIPLFSRCFMLGFDVTYASCHNLYPCSPLDTLYLSRPKRSNTFSSNKEGHSELCATRENKSPIRLLLLHPDSRKTFHGSGAGLVRYQQLILELRL